MNEERKGLREPSEKLRFDKWWMEESTSGHWLIR